MWNKWGLFFAGLAFSASACAEGPKPVDRDMFEKQYMECIMNNFKNDCVVPFVRDYIEAKDIEKLSEIYNTIAKGFLEGTNVYKVYTVHKKMGAGIFDDRLYLITAKDGGMLCTRIIFRMKAGKWYVNNLQLIGDKDEMSKLLDVPL